MLRCFGLNVNVVLPSASYKTCQTIEFPNCHHDHHELMINYHSLVFSPVRGPVLYPSLDFHYLEMVVESRYLPYSC